MGEWDKLTVDRAVDAATQLIKAIQEVNAKSRDRKFSIPEACRIFKRSALSEVRTQEAKQYLLAIDEFMREKESPTGGKGRKQLSDDTIVEWKNNVGKLLRGWIGRHKIGEYDSMAHVRKIILEKIDNHTKEDGKPWADATKRKCAQKTQEFGAWMAKPEVGYVKTNPFSGLASQYDYTKDPLKISFYKNDDVKELFKIAMYGKTSRGEDFSKMIPYLSLAFFAGLRPDSEIAKPKDSKRRYQWSDVQWDNEMPDTKWTPLLVPATREGVRAGKINISRMAELAPAGKAFMKWWAKKHNGGELPSEGEVFWRRKLLDKIKKEWKEKCDGWKADTARHTFLSNAVALNIQSKATWAERAGHDEATFNTYYNVPTLPQHAKKYFALRPSQLKDD